jgi:ABC-2 type transport system permease protein
MALLGLEHGLVAMAVGAATGKRSLALAIAGGIAVAGYMFYALGAFVDAMEPWRVVSPFSKPSKVVLLAPEYERCMCGCQP